MMFSHRRAKNFLEQVGLGSSRQALRKGVNSGLSLIQGKRCPWEIRTGNSKELWMTDFKQCCRYLLSLGPDPPVLHLLEEPDIVREKCAPAAG